MKKIFTAVLLMAVIFWPLACGKNITPTTTGPVTVIEAVNTNTPTPAGTSTPTFSPTPNPLAGYYWGIATAGAAFPARQIQSSVVYNNAMWVIGGGGNGLVIYNDVWSSTNGSTWTQALANTSTPGSTQFSQRYGQTSVVYNNAMWVIGGYNYYLSDYWYNDVWSSTNGSIWTQALANTGSPASSQFSQRYGHTSVVYNNAMWVMGGSTSSAYVGDVWTSTNGSTWTQTASAAFPPRYYATSLVYNNAMWVIGGSGNSGSLNDVWYSTDGINWYEATANANFPARCNHTSFVYNNVMWVVGGYTGSTWLNDVWYSTNGSIWTEMLANSNSPGPNQFSQRADQTSLVYNNLVWVIAGNGGGVLNDVWYSPN